MELYKIGSRIHWDFLQTKLTPTYQLLDPELPAEGRSYSKMATKIEYSRRRTSCNQRNITHDSTKPNF